MLDENLRLLGITGSSVKGYLTEGQSHLALASGEKADIAAGIEKIARQVDNLEFIPVKKERYDLVVRKEYMQTNEIRIMMRIISSAAFRQEFTHIGGYDTSDMGKIVDET